jgi:hypothetical protein
MRPHNLFHEYVHLNRWSDIVIYKSVKDKPEGETNYK